MCGLQIGCNDQPLVDQPFWISHLMHNFGSAQLSAFNIPNEFKYFGVMLDSRLRFDVHAEYAASKARKAFGKINRLINKRQGLTVQCGLELYKTLVRRHMEFSLPTWVTMPESSIKLLEKVQGQCLRVITRTSAHPSSEALEVIANVMPVRVRIEELCIKEFMRIMLQDDALN